MPIYQTSEYFTCFNCGESFKNKWTQKEAVKEFVENFKRLPIDDDNCSICDGCYLAQNT